MRRVGAVALLLLLLSGYAQQRTERALEEYVHALLAQTEDPDARQLVLASDGSWYLFHWNATGGDSPSLPQGTAYPLSYPADVVAHQPSDAFTLTVEVEDGATLNYRFVNHSDATLRLVRLRWLDVELAGQWFRLWFEGAYNEYIGRPVSPGSHWEGSIRPCLDGTAVSLPAGRYRACFTVRTAQDEAIYTAAAFTVPALA